MMYEILIPIAIANLITEQKIGIDLVNRFYDYTNYVNWSRRKKFFNSIATCWPCQTVWVTLIYLILNGEGSILQYVYQPLINMLIVDVIIKLKK